MVPFVAGSCTAPHRDFFYSSSTLPTRAFQPILSTSTSTLIRHLNSLHVPSIVTKTQHHKIRNTLEPLCPYAAKPAPSTWVGCWLFRGQSPPAPHYIFRTRHES